MTQEQADRQKRYRIRQKVKAQALLGGGTEIRLAWFGLNPDGYHVAIDEDGNRIDILTRPATAPPVQPEIERAKTKKLYSPKGMPKDSYEGVIQGIRDNNMPKERVYKMLAESTNTTQAKRLDALVRALPDGPDWFDHFPDWSEA